ncbi:MAG: sigma-70 family RNA polymerase sigma factor [Eubacterium sp.]|nr:sigma-70 family RNA polymerase sigma factor [Eubacterium sp.]
MKKNNSEKDEILVRQFQAGDDQAAEQLIERYKQMVRAHARTLFLAGGDRDDLLQEGMIGLFKAMQHYDPERSNSVPFQKYAAVCVDRQMYSAILASTRQKNQPLNTSVSLDAFAPETIERKIGSSKSPESLLLDEETVSHTLAAIKEILSKYENEVLDRYLDGMDYQEIALELKKSPKSVDNALNRMKNKVAVWFSEQDRQR